MLVGRRSWKIEWGDCDPAGIVHFPRYLFFFDSCTVSLFEQAGLPKRQMLRDYNMAGCPVVDLRVRFLIPSQYGDEVVIESAIREWRRSSFEVQHRLLRGEALAVEGVETRVWTVRDPVDTERLKGAPIPEDVRARFV
ncbi:MAG: acyl-CoA thioesterase [Alphaproteobacteria bacterium]|nr:acyl-CoA thioesterase [Alphaproteobacteria bacterium]MDE2072615.1 acyl-CoA thioesterase [Alphaproteobacteria bacterium]MDE2351888.1 acyl-CoA thioesterase [Alphaproteobacteria bacterium]